MNARELLDSFDPANPMPVYVLCPDKPPRAKHATFEPLLADRCARMISDALVEPSMRDLAFNSFSADETGAAEVVETANTVPFLAERRVVLVRRAEQFDNDRAAKHLVPYLESPNPQCVLVMISERLDRRLKLFKAADKQGYLVPSPELRENEVRLWINAAFEERAKKAHPDAVNAIVERAGTKLSGVNNAIELTAGYVGERADISEEDVIAATADVAEEEIWALTDAIAESRMGDAVRILRELFALNKSEFEILGSVNWLIRTAYDVSVAPPNSGFLRQFTARKCKPLADKFGPKKLGDAFALLTETDFMLRSTGTDRSLALELLVIKLAAPRPGQRKRQRASA